MLTVDSLRADQPWSGYKRASTPNLLALARRSVVYTSTYSVANVTTPSLAAMMSGRYPSELSRDTCALPAFRYSDSLSEVLSRAGVHTFAGHGHAIFAGAIAPSAGFDEWELVENAAGRLQVDGATTGADLATLLVRFLETRAAKRRFFAWAHFVDPHDKYVPHPEFPPTVTPQRGLYDGEVAYTDFQIGRVLGALDRAGLGEKTAVIVTADHGESFGEHQRYRHGFSLHEEEVRVPLMLRVPGVEPRVVGVTRSTIDLARTVAHLLGVPPAEVWRGASLVDDWGGAPVARTAIVDVPDHGAHVAQRAVVAGHVKVMFRGSQPTAAYDLVNDPREERPLKAQDLVKVSAAAGSLGHLPEVEGDVCQQ